MKPNIVITYPYTIELFHKFVYVFLIGVFINCLISPLSFAQNSNFDTNQFKPDTEIQYATDVAFDHPAGMAFDATGNMYFAAGVRQQIYKVDKSGLLTLVAGTGTNGFYGEGVPALIAQFDLPQKLCFDSLWNLYIADTYNYRIRKIDLQGIITTVAGNGKEGPFVISGSATQAAIGNVNSMVIDQYDNIFISCYFNSSILKVDPQGNIHLIAGKWFDGFSGDGGPASEAVLNRPTDIALDHLGNLYIADAHNNRIRKIDQQGIITTVAGNGYKGFYSDGDLAVNVSLNYPRGIYVDLDNNLFIAELNSNCIRKVDSSGTITTFAGGGIAGFSNTGFSGDGGLAINAELNEPVQVTKDHEGNLYIADVGNNRICKVNTHGVITTVAGNGKFPYILQTKSLNSTSVTAKPWYQHQAVLVAILINGIIIFAALFYFIKFNKSRQLLSQKEVDLSKEKDARRLVEKEMQDISERERNRIGQDLHDSVIQQLSGVKLMGELILEEQEDNTVFDSQYVQRLNEHLMKSIEQLRGLSKGLYPVDLHQKGLQYALRELLNTAESIYNIKCSLNCGTSIKIEDGMKSINLFRIVQEALNNALKHSKADEITIDIHQQNDEYCIILNDNGTGFHPEPEYQTDTEGMGLKIMKYRADIIGADLLIMSQPGKGTTVQCTLKMIP